MESFLGWKILQRLNRKRRITEAMEDLEDHYRLKYNETDKDAPLVAQAAVKIYLVKKETTEDEFKERLRINRETFSFILKRMSPFI